AYNAKLIIEPPNFVAIASSDNNLVQKQFKLKSIDGTWDGFDVTFDGPEFIKFEGELADENILNVRMSMLEDNFGEHEGTMMITHDGTQYRIPFLLQYTQGSISVNENNGKLSFDVYHPDEWSFVKISVINSKDGIEHTTTTTPGKTAKIDVFGNGQYWIDAKIRVNGTTTDAYNVIEITSLNGNQPISFFDIPERQIGIISIVIIGIAVFGFLKRR
ncbi:MAG: peptidase S8, partial [Nitrosopumilus sp.]|nr:peptidase S8 [Nitrosopumilus sp.]